MVLKPPPKPPATPDPAQMQKYLEELQEYQKEAEQAFKEQEEKLKKQEEAQVEALKEEQKKLTTAWKDFQDKKDTQEKELFSQSEEMTRREEALEELEGKMKTREENVRLKEEMAEENLADIDGRKTEMEKLQDRLDARDSDLTKKETDITVRERQITVKNEAIKKKANEITKKADELKVEEARIEAMKKELPTGPVPEGKEGMEATIILQQKQLLEKCMDQNEKTDKLIARQLKLEEDRVAREKERDKKEEESLATGKGFKPPSFKGIEGERPEAHILRAEDWMEASNPKMKDDQKIKNFRLTLDHHAREWYDTADCKTSWKKLKLGFSRYFSTQGRSMKNLLKRWKEFTFNPETDDIEIFVRDVQETAKQLKYDDEATANMIKINMPMEMYTSLYDEEDLDKIITKVKDIYAKPFKKGQAAASTSTAGVPSATPFSLMTDQYMYLQGANGDNKQKPFKPYVTPQGRGRGRGRGGRGRGRGGRGRGATQENRFQGVGRGQFTFRGNWQPRGSNYRGRGGQKFDKSPNVRKARVNTRTPNQDRDRCNKCHELGHWAKDCPQNQQNNGQGNNYPAQQKTFPGATYNYMYPMVPQVPMAPVAMPSNAVQASMQGNNTAALGQMQEVMMQLNEVEHQDNPIFMQLTEEEKKEEEIYLN